MSDFSSAESEEFYTDTIRILRSVDERYETRTAAVFEAAVELRPILADTLVMPLDDEELEELEEEPVPISRLGGPPNAGDVVVVLPMEHHHYLPYIDGYLQSRLIASKNHITEVQGYCGPPDVINAALAHEFWHAYATLKLVGEVGIPNALQIEMESHEAEMRQLPLNMPSTGALALWQDVSGSYRRDMERSGVDELAFQSLLEANVRAYGKLPGETAADEFALEVIETVYGSKHS